MAKSTKDVAGAIDKERRRLEHRLDTAVSQHAKRLRQLATAEASKGKKAGKAKELELAGWSYPQHLAGRAYGLIVHGDVAGIEGSRRGLSDWLDWMGFIDAGAQARLDRYIGYYEPYATSHDTLDKDEPVQEEARNVARAVAKAVTELRAGRLQAVQPALSRPRPK